MAEYSEYDASVAGRIVEGLLERNGEIPEMEGRYAVSDIEAHATEFAAELDLLEHVGLDVPAVMLGDGELVPVSISLLAAPNTSWAPPLALSGSRAPFIHPLFDEWTHLYLRSVTQSGDIPGLEVGSLPREAARAAFIRRATEFLATRITGVRNLDRQEGESGGAAFLNVPRRSRGPLVSTPGCQFVVSTNTNGLRVFWSGAYWLTSNYFSHPTSPAGAVLQSGNYVFGVDGGAYGSRIQWDLSAIVALPGRPAVHLNY